MAAITRLGLSSTPRGPYGSFAGKSEVAPAVSIAAIALADRRLGISLADKSLGISMTNHRTGA
jgi:hypothetical protein